MKSINTKERENNDLKLSVESGRAELRGERERGKEREREVAELGELVRRKEESLDSAAEAKAEVARELEAAREEAGGRGKRMEEEGEERERERKAAKRQAEIDMQ